MRSTLVPSLLVALCLAVVGPVWAFDAAGSPQPGAEATGYLDSLRAEARALRPLVETDAVRAWLDAADRLTPITPRSIYMRAEPRAVLSGAEYLALPEAERSAFTERAITEAGYYATGYGTPLCYARALDLAAAAGGVENFASWRILDYGYGQIGQMRLLAACGAEVVGVDPSVSLAARYGLPEDQGPYPPTGGAGPQGSVAIVTGFWPGEPETSEAVGGGFDLILARNVLKHGYVHPIAEVPAGSQINLSCTDEEFLHAVRGALKPGGLFLIYNLGGPRLRNGAYDPSADINCPWTRTALEAAGFEVVAFDADDSGPMREHVSIFGWARAGEALESNWFSLYTLVRRPAE